MSALCDSPRPLKPSESCSLVSDPALRDNSRADRLPSYLRSCHVCLIAEAKFKELSWILLYPHTSY